MSQALYLANAICKLMPPSRCFRLKAKIWRASGLDIHHSARIVSSVSFWGSDISVGEDTFIGHDVYIAGSVEGPVKIGSWVDIAPRTNILSGTHEIDMVGNHTAGRGHCLPITIEDGAWVGAGCTVVGGVIIGKKSMIGAGSVVVNDIPPYCLAVGIPCKPIKYWDRTSNKWTTSSTHISLEDVHEG